MASTGHHIGQHSSKHMVIDLQVQHLEGKTDSYGAHTVSRYCVAASHAFLTEPSLRPLKVDTILILQMEGPRLRGVK